MDQRTFPRWDGLPCGFRGKPSRRSELMASSILGVVEAIWGAVAARRWWLLQRG